MASLALVAALLPAREAAASGFYTADMGADHGNSYTANAYAVYYNPAALSGLEAPQITLDALVALRSASYTRSPSALSPDTPGDKATTDPNYLAANTGKAGLFNVATAPFIGAATPIGNTGLTAGYATYVPFGGSFTWNKNDAYKGNSAYPGAVDGPQRWAAISGGGISLYNSIALAYEIKPARVSIGASFNLIYNTLNTVIAKDVNSTDELNLVNGKRAENRAYVNVHNLTPSIALGIAWEPFEDHRARVGFSWQSRPNLGQMRLHGTLQTTYGAGTQSEDVLQTQPDVFRLGGMYRVTPQVELRAEAQYIRWSVFQRQCLVPAGGACNLYTDGSTAPGGNVTLAIPREWHDAGGLRVGVGYYMTKTTELFGSTSFDTSAVPDKTLDPTFMDAFKMSLRLGVKHRFNQRFGLAGSVEDVYYLPVDTNGNNALDTYKAPSKTPSEDGKYTQNLVVFNVNGTVYF